MITEHDLREAIAECEGIRNPTPSTCVKLAAYYALLDRLGEPSSFPDPEPRYYSYAEPPEQTINYNSGTEFGDVVNGKRLPDVLDVIDEMMSIVQATNPRLYDAVIRKIAE